MSGIDDEITTQVWDGITLTLTREQAFGYAELLSDIARQERRRRSYSVAVSLSDGGLLQIEGLAYQLHKRLGLAQ